MKTNAAASLMPVVPQIPIEKWGKDHWSMFGYIECRVVDNRGIVKREHMRVDFSINPLRGHAGGDAARHPTRLRGSETASPHDDWSCVEDFVREGLVEWEGTGMNPVFKLTAKGLLVAAELRKHKASGGVFSTFVWPQVS